MMSFDAVRTWYDGLEAREQKTVLIGGGVFALILLWLLVVAPFQGAKQSLREDIQANTHLLAFMTQSVQRINQLEKTTQAHAAAPQKSLFSAVENAVQHSPMKDVVTDLKLGQDHSVQIHIKAASFDHLMVWLGRVVSRFHARVAKIAVHAAKQPGTVDAALVLRDDVPS